MAEMVDQKSLVTPKWLEAHQNDSGARLIEIAGLGQDDMHAYKAGHIPGAICWNWKEMLWDSRLRDFPEPDEFARRLGAAGIGNDTTVVFYGEDMQFGVYAWWVFKYCGHSNVKLLDGARYRWVKEGRLLSTNMPPEASAVQYRPMQRNEGMRIQRDEVLDTLGEPNLVILDGRSLEEYRGERVGGPGGPDIGAVRYGRIPGARHLFFGDLLAADKSFRSIDNLRSLVAAHGIGPNKEIITYCRMSHRATVLYFVLSRILGYRNVRVYDGSWIEWGNLVGVPIER